MERIGLISDIHGEVDALEAVLSVAQAERLTRFWCLGDSLEWLLPRDFLRRGEPEALRRVLAGCEQVIAGNHEGAMIDDPSGRARILEEFDGERLFERLDALPPRRRLLCGGVPVELVHGSPLEPYWQAVETADDVRAAFASTSAQLICCGHTHLPLAATRNAQGEIDFPPPTHASGELELGEGRWIINPGSLGRSPIRSFASWAVLSFGEDGRPASVSWRQTPWARSATELF